MEIRLSKEQYYIKDGKFDQLEALKTAGLKAAVCFKQGDITPWDVREESEETLVRRGIDTILSDHVTPSQQVPISLEMYGIPKIICMYLNNLGMQAADERSLRYTEIIESEYLKDYISDSEIKIYSKWLKVLQEVLWKDYKDFFLKTNNNDEKKARIAIKKIAQENARSHVSVFMPTSLTYTSNFSELNKLCLQIERTLECDTNSELENMAWMYLFEFKEKLKQLKVVITNEDIWRIAPKVAEMRNIPKNSDYSYKNPKNLELNLFANKNKFSGIYGPDEFGVSMHATRPISFAGFAQLQRHRTLDTEIFIPDDKFEFFIPEFIKPYNNLVEEWVRDGNYIHTITYPQGQIIDVAMETTLKKLIKYVGSERACNAAQYEIAKFYMELLRDYSLTLLHDGKVHLYEQTKPYIGKYRCLTKNYKCPTPCPGGPRMDRKF